MRKFDQFILVTTAIAVMLSALYIWEAVLEGYHLPGYLIIAANVIYIPGALILGRKFFIPWLAGYTLILIYACTTTDTFLYNNYTALLSVVIVTLLQPKLKWPVIFIYSIVISIVFIYCNEAIMHYLVHMLRASSTFYVINYFIKEKYKRKPLDLTPDEIMILEELNEKKLLKACTCFSKNTLTQKLKEARDRNKIDTNAELLAEYNLIKK